MILLHIRYFYFIIIGYRVDSSLFKSYKDLVVFTKKIVIKSMYLLFIFPKISSVDI